ncbi:MAG: YtxH domain-containing protein [Thermoleophilia bacterium]
MAKLTRFLFGGVLGAGLALILSPKTGKEIRSLLMGGGRKQLQAPDAGYQTPSDYSSPAATVREESPGVSLESRIEETRQQVAREFDDTFVPAPLDTTYLTEEEPLAPVAEIEEEAPEFVAETPLEIEEEAPAFEAEATAEVEEEALEIIAETPLEIEEEAPAFEAEAQPEVEEEAPLVVEEEAPLEVEEPAPAAVEPDISPAPPVPVFEAEKTISPPVEDISGSTVSGINLNQAQREAAAREWEILKMPAEGEPSLEADLNARETPPAETAPAPSGIDRDEMRRRIDETRARLKAKAFDAMVSGETFVEGETGSPARRQEEAIEPGMDQETAEQIDDSLREED